MSMLNGIAICLGSAAIACVASCLILQFVWSRRVCALKKEMARVSDDLLQIVELQSDVYRRVRQGLSEVEEKVLELSVPTADAPLPLERRHQVLTLARKGVSADEIARRLNMPKGEAELIMNLRRYVDAQTPETAPAPPRTYVRAGAAAR
jgi:hypothetical protein